jgi:hypothetical protein
MSPRTREGSADPRSAGRIPAPRGALGGSNGRALLHLERSCIRTQEWIANEQEHDRHTHRCAGLRHSAEARFPPIGLSRRGPAQDRSRLQPGGTRNDHDGAHARPTRPLDDVFVRGEGIPVRVARARSALGVGAEALAPASHSLASLQERRSTRLLQPVRHSSRGPSAPRHCGEGGHLCSGRRGKDIFRLRPDRGDRDAPHRVGFPHTRGALVR